MRTYNNLHEDDDQDFYLLQDRDLVVTIKKPHTVEDADKALNNKDNYGRYTSTMRNSKVTPEDVDKHFGPEVRTLRI